MNSPEDQKRYDRAYQQAMDIIDREWLAAGMTREELDQEARLADLYDELLASGQSREEIIARWEGKTVAEILADHAAAVPLARVA